MRRWVAVVSAVVLLAGCSASGSARPRDDAPRAPSSVLTGGIDGAAVDAPAAVAPAPLDPTATYAAVPRERFVGMWDTFDPGAPRSFSFDTRNPLGTRSPLLVEGSRVDDSGRRWLQVQLPIRPNGTTAWTPQDEVRLVPQPDRIVVDLSQRTLRRYVRGELVDRFRVGVGQPRYPTAIGTFYVWVKVTYGPGSVYGPMALGLSGFSPVLSDWPGGGRMAIHGTSNPADLGAQVSHGCIRVYNPQLLSLRNVPLGTPVVIRA